MKSYSYSSDFKRIRFKELVLFNVMFTTFFMINTLSFSQMPSKASADKETKILNAMSAAPKSISANAIIMDWPKKMGDQPTVLRPGNNGWTCYPDMPQSEGNDPMCLDKQWVTFFDAYMKKETPKITQVGFAYMLAGDSYVSNTDPFATEETPDNEWGQEGPHIMVLVPDNNALQGMNWDRTKGEPYVMFRNTPYAHIMVPVPAVSDLSSN